MMKDRLQFMGFLCLMFAGMVIESSMPLAVLSIIVAFIMVKGGEEIEN